MLKVDIRSFSYSSTEILSHISFELKRGSHLAVLGESGCGKSTLLHLIYGLLHLEGGKIIWDNKELKGPTFNLVPGEKFMKLVAQEFNVMPFTTVAENVAEHLDRNNIPQDESRVNELLAVVDLTSFRNAMVKNLSGGQKQRVALAKALANEPELLLLDEPFSHIDTFRKNTLRRRLYAYLKAKNISCITATHDSEEALAFSDCILILQDGKISATGTPEQLYNNVATEYPAGFFNEVNKLPSKHFPGLTTLDEVVLFPHQLKITNKATPISAIVKQSFFKGSHYLIHSVWKGQDLFVNHKEKLIPGHKIFISHA